MKKIEITDAHYLKTVYSFVIEILTLTKAATTFPKKSRLAEERIEFKFEEY